jgi:hypothetical protein
MPKRYMNKYMVVKTDKGYVKVDKNNIRREIVDEELHNILGDIGALGGIVLKSHEKRKKNVNKAK